MYDQLQDFLSHFVMSPRTVWHFEFRFVESVVTEQFSKVDLDFILRNEDASSPAQGSSLVKALAIRFWQTVHSSLLCDAAG